MDTFGIIRGATRLVVSAGVGAVVKNAIKHTTPADLKRFDKLIVKVGTLAVTGIVAEAATKYAVEQVNSVEEQFTKAAKQLEEVQPKLDEAAGNIDKAAQALKDAAEHTGEAFFKAKDVE